MFFERSLNGLAEVARKAEDNTKLQIYAAKVRKDRNKIAEIVNKAIFSEEEISSEEDKQCSKDYAIAEIVKSLSMIGEFDLARQALASIVDREKSAKARMALSEESRDLEDLRDLERFVNSEMIDGFEKDRMTEKLIALLSKEKKYIWAEVLAKNSENPISNYGVIAKKALENNDQDISIEFALNGQEIDPLFAIFHNVLMKDVQKARELAERMQDLWWGSFYRSWAYYFIYRSNGSSEDIDRAASIILEAIKNEELHGSSSEYFELALKIAMISKNAEMVERLSKLLDPLNWRSQEIMEKSFEKLFSSGKKIR